MPKKHEPYSLQDTLDTAYGLLKKAGMKPDGKLMQSLKHHALAECTPLPIPPAKPAHAHPKGWWYGPAAGDPNSRRLYDAGNGQWAKIYGWDPTNAEVRAEHIVKALTLYGLARDGLILPDKDDPSTYPALMSGFPDAMDVMEHLNQHDSPQTPVQQGMMMASGALLSTKSPALAVYVLAAYLTLFPDTDFSK